jgi:hypothetical protein
MSSNCLTMPPNRRVRRQCRQLTLARSHELTMSALLTPHKRECITPTQPINVLSPSSLRDSIAFSRSSPSDSTSSPSRDRGDVPGGATGGGYGRTPDVVVANAGIVGQSEDDRVVGELCRIAAKVACELYAWIENPEPMVFLLFETAAMHSDSSTSRPLHPTSMLTPQRLSS